MAAERPNAKKSAEVSIKSSQTSEVKSPRRSTGSNRKRLSPLANTLGRIALVGGALGVAGYGGWLVNEAYDNDHEDTHGIVLALPGSGNIVVADNNSGNIGNIDNHSENNTSTDTETNKEFSNNKNKDFGPKELPNTGFGQQFSVDQVKSLVGNNLEITLDASKRGGNFDTLAWATRDKIEEITGVEMDETTNWNFVDAIAKDNGKESGSAFNVLADGDVLDLRIGDNAAQILADEVIPLSGAVLDSSQKDHSGIQPPNTGTGGEEIGTFGANGECIPTDLKGNFDWSGDSERHLVNDPASFHLQNVGTSTECPDTVWVHAFATNEKPHTENWLTTQEHIGSQSYDIELGAQDQRESFDIADTEKCFVQIDLVRTGEVRTPPEYNQSDLSMIDWGLWENPDCKVTPTPTVSPMATAIATGTASSEPCIETDVKGDLEDNNHFSENPVKGVVSNIAKNVICSDDIYIHMYGSMQFPETSGWLESQKGNHIKTIKIDVPEGSIDRPIKDIIGEDVIVPNTEFCWVQVDLTRDGEIKEIPYYANNDHVFVKDVDSCLPTATVTNTATVTATGTATPPPTETEGHRRNTSTPTSTPTETNTPVPTVTTAPAEKTPTPPAAIAGPDLPDTGYGFSAKGKRDFNDIAMYMAFLGTAAVAAGAFTDRFRRRFSLGTNVLVNPLDRTLKIADEEDDSEDQVAINNR